MSILIKGMEMPTERRYHCICIYSDGTVVTGSGEYTAVQLMPHGDLIDRDELFRIDRNIYGMDCVIGERHNFYDDEILDLPVVIEAEESE